MKLWLRKASCGCIYHRITGKLVARHMHCDEHGIAKLVAETRARQFGDWRHDEQHYPDHQPLRSDQCWRFDPDGVGWVRVNAKGEIDEP